MKLRDYLEATKVRQEVFSKHIGITHRTLVNVLQGKTISLRTAMRIEKGTCGAVTCEELDLEAENQHANQKKNKTTQQNQTPLQTPISTNNAT
jgi:plasmid maintenance system antidote protein VapI